MKHILMIALVGLAPLASANPLNASPPLPAGRDPDVNAADLGAEAGPWEVDRRGYGQEDLENTRGDEECLSVLLGDYDQI